MSGDTTHHAEDSVHQNSIPCKQNCRIIIEICLKNVAEGADGSQLQQEPCPLTLTEHLQQELSCKHMLFQKHHLELSKVVGQGSYVLVCM